jgi:antitoxin HigA-1
MSKAEKLMPPVHPGEVLRADFMEPLGLSINKLALDLHVAPTRIGEIVHERRRITADTALRLARYFNTNAEFWLNLQNFYDLEVTRRSGAASEIERHVHTAPASAHY